MSHDAALDDLAVRRTSVYAALVPLTPARLGRRSRSSVLTGVVDDLTDVVEAQVRVTVPLISSAPRGARRRPAHRVVRPGGRARARRAARRGRRHLLAGVAARVAFSRRAARVAGRGAAGQRPRGAPGRPSCRRSAATGTAAGWLDRGARHAAPGGAAAEPRSCTRRRDAARGHRRGHAARRLPRRPRRHRSARSRRCSSSCRSPSATPWPRSSTRCVTSPGRRAARFASTPCSTRSRR